MTLAILFPPGVAIIEKSRVLLASPRCVVTGVVDDDDEIIWLWWWPVEEDDDARMP